MASASMEVSASRHCVFAREMCALRMPNSLPSSSRTMGMCDAIRFELPMVTSAPKECSRMNSRSTGVRVSSLNFGMYMAASAMSVSRRENLTGGHETIADSTHCDEVLGFAGIGFEVPAQADDEVVDSACVGVFLN